MGLSLSAVPVRTKDCLRVLDEVEMGGRVRGGTYSVISPGFTKLSLRVLSAAIRTSVTYKPRRGMFVLYAPHNARRSPRESQCWGLSSAHLQNPRVQLEAL